MMKNAAIKGKYKPKFPAKYRGDVNRITYRSLWERRFMLYCDRSDQIKKWQSEEVHIPYFDDEKNKWRNYYPDFVVDTLDGRIIMVEIKPEHQWQWKINKAKWAAAKEWCKVRGFEFIVMGKRALYGK